MTVLQAYFMGFMASFWFVFLKAFQQLNVVKYAYVWVVPTSAMMAVCEVFVVSNYAKYGFGWMVACIGVGSGLGVICSMWIHRRFIKAN